MFQKKLIKEDEMSGNEKAFLKGKEEGIVFEVRPVSMSLYLKKEDLNCVECGRKISEVYTF